MKHILKQYGVILLIFASPLIFMFIIDAGIIIIGTAHSEILHQTMHRDIFSYVQENKDTLPRNDSGYDPHIAYSEYNDIGVTVVYGYYYSEDDTYEAVPVSEKNRYRDGYRSDGWYGDDLDWYYTAKICDNWYYFEYHDG